MKRLPFRRPHWTTILFVVIAIVAAPRLIPHLQALVDIRQKRVAQPSFATRTLAGNVLTQDSLRGRVVLVNVWATWCLPCRVEMPLMENTWQRHRDAGLIVLGASVDRGDPHNVQTFVTERNITYPIAIVDANFIAALGGVVGYPTSILIGRDGTVRHKVIGPIGPLSLEPAIRRAVADPVRSSQEMPSK